MGICESLSAYYLIDEKKKREKRNSLLPVKKCNVHLGDLELENECQYSSRRVQVSVQRRRRRRRAALLQ